MKATRYERRPTAQCANPAPSLASEARKAALEEQRFYARGRGDLAEVRAITRRLSLVALKGGRRG